MNKQSLCLPGAHKFSEDQISFSFLCFAPIPLGCGLGERCNLIAAEGWSRTFGESSEPGCQGGHFLTPAAPPKAAGIRKLLCLYKSHCLPCKT